MTRAYRNRASHPSVDRVGISDGALPPEARTLLVVAGQLFASVGLAVGPMAEAPPRSPLVDVDAVAAAVGVSKWSIYRWAAEGRIPSVSAGRKRRFELDAVVAALRLSPPPPTAGGTPATATARSPRARSAHGDRRQQVTDRITSRSATSGNHQSSGPSPSSEPASHADRLRAVIAATRALGDR